MEKERTEQPRCVRLNASVRVFLYTLNCWAALAAGPLVPVFQWGEAGGSHLCVVQPGPGDFAIALVLPVAAAAHPGWLQ